MKFPLPVSSARIFLWLLGAGAIITGCKPPEKVAAVPEPKVAGETVCMPANSPQLAALTVEAIGAQRQAFVPLTGRLVWDENSTVRVFSPFMGIVRELFVDVNEPVKAGQPLARLQSGDFGQVQADVRKAASDFLRTERNLTRVRDLVEHGAAPRKDLEGAEADYSSAQAEKDRAEARLAIYNSKISTSPTNDGFLLPSPLGGLLVERNVTLGQEVRPDQMLANVPQFTAPLFVVSDPTKLWVWLDVTEMHLPLVHAGQALTLRSKAFPGREFKGRLDLISDSLDPATRTVRARGTVDNADGLLKAELYVTVELPDMVPSSLQIPSKAVFLRGEQYYVFLETSAGMYQRHPVRLGSEREGRVAVLDGLKEGQRLVTEGCLLLQSLMDNAPNS
jgi:cobalt-zinc-cadmium efflux system membrane fusion protein